MISGLMPRIIGAVRRPANKAGESLRSRIYNADCRSWRSRSASGTFRLDFQKIVLR
jgi:hypothetical protein